MKVEALLYERLPDGAVRCGACQRRCLIEQGEEGWCKTRRNEDGTLHSLIYGEVSSISVNPIEKKPVFHFHPGSRWLSLGSVGCNFRCPGCQNWEISHWTRGVMATKYLSPDDCVGAAKNSGCIGLSWTFNEPTLWLEYTLDAAKAAKRAGLYTNYVTNGSITGEALAAIAPFLDVFRVDIKGFSDATYERIGHIAETPGILETVSQAKSHGMHVEVVTNIIPRFNDSESELQGIATWIRENLGPETPWHLTQFYPHLQLAHLPPTPIAQLEAARTIGTEAGLWYVYLGNVPGHPWENTYCHSCGELLIERWVFDILANRVNDGSCPACGERIPGTFEGG
ncbi:MAG: AmmeMemoRadiSam system radical SAM enzyme [Gemmatimonadota bacterium]|nr:MAG: AmmeMemoRadiSam system radical SAM enzyme [Gemmatimonadota bacterium]